jgi:hypothetical protein
MAGMMHHSKLFDVLFILLDLSLIGGLLSLILAPPDKRAKKRKQGWVVVVIGTLQLIFSIAEIISN